MQIYVSIVIGRSLNAAFSCPALIGAYSTSRQYVKQVPPALSMKPNQPKHDRRPTGVTILLALGVMAIALCLRSPILTVSPLLDTIQDDLGVPATIMGLLTTTPVICFGIFAGFAPRLAELVGIDKVIVGMIALLGLGIVIRSLPPLAALFGGTIVIGAAIAVGNVLMPALVKRDFPHHISLMTSLYVMSISIGGSLGAGATIPVQHRFDLTWRATLAIWLVPVAIALAFHAPRAWRGRGATLPRGNAPRIRLWGDRLAWNVSLFMGLQSFMFYSVGSWIPAILTDGGMDDGRAGFMLSVTNIVGLFASFAAPILARKGRDQRWLILVVIGIWTVAMTGLVIDPTSWTVIWMILFGGASGAALSMGLSLIVLRAPDTAHAATLSGMAQGVGYLIAATGPFMMGALHDLSGGWRLPLVVALVMLVPTLIAGLGAGRKRFVGQHV